ncbi:MAG: hypothetical protein IIZ41_02985 [Lachnospiraceae bacterium]|nr:hypothetical protein [Lachnospiraceae bacterium]
MKKKIIWTTVVVVFLLLFSGCIKTHTVMKTEYFKNTAMTDKFFDNLNITTAEYEMIYPSEYWGKIEIGSPGPADPRYRGVIYIPESEGKRIMEDYQWKKNSYNLPDIGNTDSNIVWGGDWYVSEQFNNDVFKLGHDEDIRFDGKDKIIFSFGTT